MELREIEKIIKNYGVGVLKLYEAKLRKIDFGTLVFSIALYYGIAGYKNKSGHSNNANDYTKILIA